MAIRTRKKQSTLRLWLLVALLVVVGALIFMLPTGEETPVEQNDATAETVADETETTTLVKEGMQAPDFTVTMFDGTTQTLSALKGKVVLVNFWATWCPPCREELKRVQADIVDRFAGQEFVFIPISRAEERRPWPRSVSRWVTRSRWASTPSAKSTISSPRTSSPQLPDRSRGQGGDCLGRV